MSVSVDEITRKKLILVKQLYQHAVIQSASLHSTINRILSVIGFDLAVETVLKAIVSSLDSSKPPTNEFQGLVQQNEQLLLKIGCSQVPDKAKIQHIHSLRNDAQHKSKYPNESDVSDCRTYSRDFLHKVFTDVWGQDFDNISLTDLVQDSTVKQFLMDAEIALGKDDYQKAAQKAATGLTSALNHVKMAVVGRLPSFGFNGHLSESESSARETRRAVERMQETLLYVALGMNYSNYMKSRQIAGTVIFSVDGTPNFYGGEKSITKSDAEFVVSYSIDVVIQIETCVGSLDKPFGSDRWY